MKEELIAPCGLNCGVCRYYLGRVKGLYKSEKSGCEGCVPRGEGCVIGGGCETIRTKSVRFCYECGDFPCEMFKRLERRYAGKYRTSLKENLQNIRDNGLEKFLLDEEQKWTCKECGGTVSVHTRSCFDCGKEQV